MRPKPDRYGGIRWRVSIHPELSAEGSGVRLLKRGGSGKLLDQLCRWGPQAGWAPGHASCTSVIWRTHRHGRRTPPPWCSGGAVCVASAAMGGTTSVRLACLVLYRLGHHQNIVRGQDLFAGKIRFQGNVVVRHS